MLLEGPQQTTGSIGQTWKTGNGRSRLVLTGQHKHTPPPPTPREPRGGRNNKGNTTPHTRGGPRTEHNPASTMQTTTNPPPTPGTNKRNGRGAGKTTTTHNTTEQHPTNRTTRAPHTPPHVSVVIAGRQRPDPSRTRKLRPPAPMVLRPPGRGRAGHHRAHTTPPPPTQNDGRRGETNNNTTTPDQETCHRLTGRLIQKQIPPQPKDHIHVPGQARQSVALPQCTFSW